MTALHRRDQILDRIEARCRIEDTGFVLDNNPSPPANGDPLEKPAAACCTNQIHHYPVRKHSHAS